VEGLHVPLIPFVEVVGKTGATEPVHIGGTGSNNGMIPPAVTVTVNVAVDAHCPAVGVNVYVAVAVLLTVEGLHVPLIPFVDVDGNTGATDPLQIGAIAAKVGVIPGVTVTVSVAVAAHWPAVGVNV
jgi:hypothetical protein